jgi:hypothetical protein
MEDVGFASPQLTVQPTVSAGALTGERSGSFISPQISIRPVIRTKYLGPPLERMVEVLGLNSAVTLTITRTSVVGLERKQI